MEEIFKSARKHAEDSQRARHKGKDVAYLDLELQIQQCLNRRDKERKERALLKQEA